MSSSTLASSNDDFAVEKDPELAFAHNEQAGQVGPPCGPQIDHAETHQKSKIEKRLVLKQDLTIVLLLSGCFWFAYLDRGAIGNARVMGYQTDLGLSNSQFFTCLMMFYIGYLLWEVPAALSLRYLPPNFVYGSITVLFGLFACLMVVAKSEAGVIVLRLLVGAAEAYVQTGNVFLSLWYRRNELTTRIACFFVTAPIAGAMSGLIAYGVDKNLDGKCGMKSWQWFYLVEGIPTIFWGLLIIVVLPRLPEKVAVKGHFLFKRKDERQLILERLSAGQNTADEKVELWQCWWALKEPKTWISAPIIGASAVNIAAFGAFLPTLIYAAGFSQLNTQLYSMIPYAFGTLTMIAGSILSDRTSLRALPCLAWLSLTILGYIVLLTSADKVTVIVGTSLVAAGTYPALIICTSWIMNNTAGYTKRCTTWGVSHLFIQVYSIICTQIYTKAPRFFAGHGTLLGLNCLAAVCVVVNYFLWKRENMKRDQRAQMFKIRGEKDPDEAKSLNELCDYHPSFRYQL